MPSVIVRQTARSRRPARTENASAKLARPLCQFSRTKTIGRKDWCQPFANIKPKSRLEDFIAISVRQHSSRRSSFDSRRTPARSLRRYLRARFASRLTVSTEKELSPYHFFSRTAKLRFSSTIPPIIGSLGRDRFVACMRPFRCRRATIAYGPNAIRYSLLRCRPPRRAFVIQPRRSNVCSARITVERCIFSSQAIYASDGQAYPRSAFICSHSSTATRTDAPGKKTSRTTRPSQRWRPW